MTTNDSRKSEILNQRSLTRSLGGRCVVPQRVQRTTCVRLGAIVWMTMLCGAAWAAELGNVAPEFSAAGRADNPEVKAAKERFSEAVELIRLGCRGDAVIVTHRDVMELFLGVPAPEYAGFLQVEVGEHSEEAERYRVVRRIETRADKDSLWWFRK